MAEIVVNGRRLQCDEGETILEVCSRNGIEIPALCHHESVEPYGACRLCTVEVSHPKWPGWKDYVASCLYPVRDGLVVQTNTPRVRRLRATLLDLLLARVPGSDVIRKLAEEYGVSGTTYFLHEAPRNCILCGLCVRVCDEVMGRSAIWTAGRGVLRKIRTPLQEPPPDCIGCGACAYVCPTDAIPLTETANKRIIWDREFEMLKCKECGRAHITVAQRDWLIEKNDLPEDYYDLCDACKRKAVSHTQSTLSAF